MQPNLEFYRLTSVFFQKNRLLFFVIMINLKILKTLNNNNFIVFLNLFFYKKKIVTKFKHKTHALILWKNSKKMLCGYCVLKKRDLLKTFCNKDNLLKIFFLSLHIDMRCVIFDLFSLFKNNYISEILILILRKNTIIKQIRLKKIISEITKYSIKNNFILKLFVNYLKRTYNS